MSCPLTQDELREAYAVEGEQRRRLHVWQVLRFMDAIDQMEAGHSTWKERGLRRKPIQITVEHWTGFFFPMSIVEAKEICKQTERGQDVWRKIQKLFKKKMTAEECNERRAARRAAIRKAERGEMSSEKV